MLLEKIFDRYTVVQKSMQKDDILYNSELQTLLIRISSWQYLQLAVSPK